MCKVCLQCGKDLTKKQKKFCSRKCLSLAHANARGACAKCGAVLKPHQYKYCSNKCQMSGGWEKKLEDFESSGHFNGSKYTVSRAWKRYLKETQGVRCSVCGLTEWLGHEIPLILDHVNGNSTDNSQGNLRLVCGNCDMQLPTYKGKNYGNGRVSRRRRYAEGKSY